MTGFIWTVSIATSQKPIKCHNMLCVIKNLLCWSTYISLFDCHITMNFNLVIYIGGFLTNAIIVHVCSPNEFLIMINNLRKLRHFLCTICNYKVHYELFSFASKIDNWCTVNIVYKSGNYINLLRTKVYLSTIYVNRCYKCKYKCNIVKTYSCI